jgi:alpha-mannosidase
MVYTNEGVPLHGLTGGRWRDRRAEFIIPKEWKTGQKHTFYIETSMNGMFGMYSYLTERCNLTFVLGCHPEPLVMPKDGLDIGSFTKPPDPHRSFKLNIAELRVPNMDAWRLFWDYMVIQDVALKQPENSWEAQEAFRTAIDIINAFKRGNQKSLIEGRKIAQRILGSSVDSHNTYSAADDETIIWAIGHCHIDTAWLWPFAETKRKVARSWATQCDLMDRYPEHTFAASTAQQYLWLKEDYPGLFDRVKSRVKEGRFVPVGGVSTRQ